MIHKPCEPFLEPFSHNSTKFYPKSIHSCMHLQLLSKYYLLNKENLIKIVRSRQSYNKMPNAEVLTLQVACKSNI